MKVRTLAIALALLTLAVPTTATTDDIDTAEITLTVETHAAQTLGWDAGEPHEDIPGTATCTVTVQEGDDGGDVLDQATKDGCIAGWDYTTFDGERFITEIDDLRADGLTCLAFMAGVCDWWQHNVNDASIGYGIDGYSAQDGDHVHWVYQNTL